MADVSAAGEAAPSRREWRAIPPLRGRVLAVYTAIWWLGVAVALAAMGAGAFYQHRSFTQPVYAPLGIDMHSNEGFLQIALVHSEEARRAGLDYGDEVVAIDGRPVPRTSRARDIARTWLERPEGTAVRLTVREGQGETRQITLTRRSAHVDSLYAGTGLTPAADIWFSIIANLLIAALFLVASVFLFRLRRAPVAAIFAAAFLLTAMTGRSDLWSLAGLTGVSDILNTVGWTAMIAGMLIFPDGRFPSRLPLAVAAFCAATMPITTINMFGQNVTNLIFMAQFLLAAVVLAMRYRGLPAGSERQQMRWAFFGFAIAVVLLAVAVICITIYTSPAGATVWRHAWLPIFGQSLLVLAVASIVGGLLVSVLRFRLYDADTVIGRSAAIGVLTLGFVALFAGSEKLVEVIGERYFADSAGLGAGAIGAAIAAVMIVPLHNRVHGWAERRFQKALIRLREGLPQCVDDLRESATVKQLASAVMNRVQTGVRSTREAVLFREGAKWTIAGTHGAAAKALEHWQLGWPGALGGQMIECDGTDAMFPVRVRLRIDSGEAPETVGWLLLGPRPDGTLFGRDEREALAHIAEPVARALHIASLRQSRERNAETRLKLLEQLVEKLAVTLNSRAGGSAVA